MILDGSFIFNRHSECRSYKYLIFRVLEVGKLKAQVCIACHRPDGNSINPEFPSLSGQPAQAISTAFFAFEKVIVKIKS